MFMISILSKDSNSKIKSRFGRAAELPMHHTLKSQFN